MGMEKFLGKWAFYISKRIGEAVVRFPADPAKVKEFVGEYGWLTIEQQGGWDAVVQAKQSEPTSVAKKWEMAAQSVLEEAEKFSFLKSGLRR